MKHLLNTICVLEENYDVKYVFEVFIDTEFWLASELRFLVDLNGMLWATSETEDGIYEEIQNAIKIYHFRSVNPIIS